MDIMDCDYEDDAGNCSSPHGCYCAEIAAAVLRDEKAAALIASQARRIEELETVYDAARGLCYGEDWNNGTHAKSRGYRQKLVAAVNAIEPLPPRATLKGETP